MKKKRINIIIPLVLILLSLCFIRFGNTLCADNSLLNLQNELSQNVDGILDNIDFTELQNIFEGVDTSSNLFGIKNIKTFVKSIINGDFKINYSSIFEVLLNVGLSCVKYYIPIISVIIAISVISSLLGQIKSKFNENSTADLVHFVCFCVIIVAVSSCVSFLIGQCQKSINSMVGQLNSVFPILLTLMTGVGSASSVSVFQPSMAVLTNLSSVMFSKVVVPIFTASFVLNVVGNLSTNIKLAKFSKFLYSTFKWLVGIVFTVFFATMSIYGITAGSFDSVSMRTVKFTMSSYVPILGGYLSQGMDMIVASSILIKNAIGLVGVLIIISTIIKPLLNIIVFSLLIKLCSAIVEPLNNNRITNFLHTTSTTITMLSSIIIVIGLMYFISMGLLMSTANIL